MRYRAYDLATVSDMTIPGAQLLDDTGAPALAPVPAADDGAPDLRVTVGPAAMHSTLRSAGPYRLAYDGSFHFHMCDVAQYLFHPGASRLTVQPAPGAAAPLVSAMLVATALPCWLWLRGEAVLHAAAARMPGSDFGFALTGPSGIGKSSAVRCLLAAGWDVLGDDTLRLRTAAAPNSPVCASGLPAATQLLQAPAERLWVQVPRNRQATSAGLCCVVELSRDPTVRPGTLHRLRGPDALATLLRNLHRPRVPGLLGLGPRLLPFLAEILLSVAVYKWHPREGGVHAAEELGALRELPGSQESARMARARDSHAANGSGA